MEIVRWITFKGKHLPIGADGKIIKEDKKDMWGNKVDEVDNRYKLSNKEFNQLKKISDKKEFYKKATNARWNKMKDYLKENSKGFTEYNKNDDGRDSLYGFNMDDDYHSISDKDYAGIKSVGGYSNKMGQYRDTTQEELNNLPVTIKTYMGSNGTTYQAYKNIKELRQDMKNFGGIKEYSGGYYYSIQSESGIGEYYLENDSYYKGGKVWKDVNGSVVKGAEKVDHSRREKKIEQRDAEFKKYIEEKYGISYEEWMKR